MKNTYTLVFILLFSISFLQAQLETAHWYFGNGAGIDFSSGTAQVDLSGKLYTSEGCSAISDTKGNLLFYTDGEDNTMNRNHTPLLNGFDLYGNNSSSQSAIIVPRPGNKDHYYIFTVDANDMNPFGIRGLNYSLVDMTLDGGLGGVVLTEKNINLLPKSSEKVSAVKHKNGKHYWVISHFEDSFYVFLITETGVHTTPIISKVGEKILYTDPSNPNITFYPCNGRGTLKFSPNGKKLAVAHLSNLKSYPNDILFDPSISTNANNGYSYATNGLLALYDFDNGTGIVSNEIVLNNQATFYGVEFSPNSDILYADEDYYDQNSRTKYASYTGLLYSFQKGVLVQYDLKSTNIPLSRYEIPGANFPLDFSTADSKLGARGTLQTALDGKIYHSTLNYYALHTISSPNVLGGGCNFKFNAFPTTNQVQYGLPPFITSFFNGNITLDGEFNLIDLCVNQPYTFQFQTSDPIDSIVWDFGDGSTSTATSPTHSYSKAGTYEVVVTVISEGNTYFFSKSLIVFDLPVTKNAVLIECEDEPLDGFTLFNLKNSESQLVTTPSDYTFSYFLTPSDAEENKNPLPILYRNTLPNQQTIIAKITNKNKCSSYAQVELKTNSKRFILDDLHACDTGKNGKQFFNLTLQETKMNSLLGGGGSYTYGYFKNEKDALLNQSPISTPTSYENENSPEQIIYVRANQASDCASIFTFKLIINPLPKPNLGSDKKICVNESVLLDAGNGFKKYLWNTGAITQTLSVNKPGNYSVTVWNSFDCSDSDEIIISEKKNPQLIEVKISNKKDVELIAQGEPILEYSIDGTNWQRSAFFYGLTHGKYTGYVRSSEGCETATLPFELEDNTILLGQEGFSPNDDGINDTFKIRNIELYPENKIEIYNRWGILVYEAEGYNNESIVFEGKSKGRLTLSQGEKLPEGTYFYFLKYTDSLGVTQKKEGYLYIKL